MTIPAWVVYLIVLIVWYKLGSWTIRTGSLFTSAFITVISLAGIIYFIFPVGMGGLVTIFLMFIGAMYGAALNDPT